MPLLLLKLPLENGAQAQVSRPDPVHGGQYTPDSTILCWVLQHPSARRPGLRDAAAGPDCVAGHLAGVWPRDSLGGSHAFLCSRCSV